jgi:hypothetical protein
MWTSFKVKVDGKGLNVNIKIEFSAKILWLMFMDKFYD